MPRKIKSKHRMTKISRKTFMLQPVIDSKRSIGNLTTQKPVFQHIINLEISRKRAKKFKN
jgi:hypothetical protein